MHFPFLLYMPVYYLHSPCMLIHFLHSVWDSLFPIHCNTLELQQSCSLLPAVCKNCQNKKNCQQEKITFYMHFGYLHYICMLSTTCHSPFCMLIHFCTLCGGILSFQYIGDTAVHWSCSLYYSVVPEQSIAVYAGFCEKLEECHTSRFVNFLMNF